MLWVPHHQNFLIAEVVFCILSSKLKISLLFNNQRLGYRERVASVTKTRVVYVLAEKLE
jgi:hypothetical protein